MLKQEDLDAMEAEVARLLAEAKAQEAKLQTLVDARKYAQRLESEQDDRVAWAYARMHRASRSCEAAWDVFEGRTP